MLYLVSTPIGNLEDITLRALNTLFLANAILCEDTRKTALLLKHFQKPGQVIPELISFYEENEISKMPEVIYRLKSGLNIALVSNAGTPTISDPGFKLVRECFKEKIKVISIPGPSSIIAGLSVSGLPTDKFLFLGFLPEKESRKIKLFNELKESLNHISSTVIFFESPYRLVKSLEVMQKSLGDVEIVVCRELTKVYEEVFHEKISNLIEKFSKRKPKGEFVVLFNLKS